jgi:predicted alpha/beta superfamily hydrolase
MKPSFISLLFAAALPALGSTNAATPPYPPFAIANSELRVLPPSATGRHYQLSVALPGSYASQPNRRYPVLYVTDGYWDFPTVQTSYANLVYDRVVPEIIIVGIGYAGENPNYGHLRRWELSPVPTDEDSAGSGHAADFLRTIEQEIIPFVEHEYRVDASDRVMAGSSLGGLFTLYSMYARPGLFQAYIAVSPAVREQHEWLLGYEDAFAQAGRPLKARLFMSGAENEWPTFLAAIERFHQRLAQRTYPGFVFQYRPVDGMRHAGTKAEGYVRGMQFVFAPFAPETGPMSEDHPY